MQIAQASQAISAKLEMSQVRLANSDLVPASGGPELCHQMKSRLRRAKQRPDTSKLACVGKTSVSAFRHNEMERLWPGLRMRI